MAKMFGVFCVRGEVWVWVGKVCQYSVFPNIPYPNTGFWNTREQIVIFLNS